MHIYTPPTNITTTPSLLSEPLTTMKNKQHLNSHMQMNNTTHNIQKE